MYIYEHPSLYRSQAGFEVSRMSLLHPRAIHIKHCYYDESNLKVSPMNRERISADYFMGFIANKTKFRKAEDREGLYISEAVDLGRFTLEDLRCRYFGYLMCMSFHTHSMTTKNLMLVRIRDQKDNTRFKLGKVNEKSKKNNLFTFFFDFCLELENLPTSLLLHEKDTSGLNRRQIEQLSFCSSRRYSNMRKSFNYDYWDTNRCTSRIPVRVVENRYIGLFIMDLKRSKYLKMTTLSVYRVFKEMGFKTLKDCKIILLGDTYFLGRLSRFYAVMRIVKEEDEDNQSQEIDSSEESPENDLEEDSDSSETSKEDQGVTPAMYHPKNKTPNNSEYRLTQEDDNYSETVTNISDKPEYPLEERRLMIVDNIWSLSPTFRWETTHKTFVTKIFDNNHVCQTWHDRTHIHLRFIHEVTGEEQKILVSKENLPPLGLYILACRLSDTHFLIKSDLCMLLYDRADNRVLSYIRSSHFCDYNLAECAVSGSSLVTYFSPMCYIEVFEVDIEAREWRIQGGLHLIEFFFDKTGKELHQIIHIFGFKRLPSGDYQILLTCDAYKNARKTSIVE